MDVNCVVRLGEAAANGAATRNYVKYSEELFTEMMELHAGGVSIPRICERPGMPCVTSLAKWCAEKPDLSRRRSRARLDYADAIFDEALDIADDSSGDIVMKEDKAGNLFPSIQHDVIQRAKLRVDTRMKIAAKINPAKYGERLELAGDVAEARGMTDEKLLASIAGLLGQLGIDADSLAALVPLGHGEPTRH